MAGSLVQCETVYLRGLLTELGFPPLGLTEQCMENSGAINLADDPVSNAKSKHIHRHELKICELVARQHHQAQERQERGQHGAHLHQATWPSVSLLRSTATPCLAFAIRLRIYTSCPFTVLPGIAGV
eukprot:6213770-Pleurochrysis_carterae.AAC.2